MIEPSGLTPANLASHIGVDLSTLNWLAYQSEVSKFDHYFRYQVEKSTGGYRTICSPKPFLKTVQGWINKNLLSSLDPSPFATAYVKGGGIVQNASAHVNRPLIIHLDLTEFFSSITYPRIRGLLEAEGYRKDVSVLLALLCTEYQREKRYWPCNGGIVYVAQMSSERQGLSSRSLPQGACTSPALSNAIAKPMDIAIGGYVERFGVRYTRYSDDMFLSFPYPDVRLGHFLKVIKEKIVAYGFSINEKKTRFLRRHQKQIIAGVVVNKKLNVDRWYYKHLRARLHYCESGHLQCYLGRKLAGMVAFVNSIDASKAAKLLEKHPWLKSVQDPDNLISLDELSYAIRESGVLYNKDLGIVIELSSEKRFVWSCRERNYVQVNPDRFFDESRVVLDDLIRGAAISLRMRGIAEIAG